MGRARPHQSSENTSLDWTGFIALSAGRCCPCCWSCCWSPAGFTVIVVGAPPVVSGSRAGGGSGAGADGGALGGGAGGSAVVVADGAAEAVGGAAGCAG